MKKILPALKLHISKKIRPVVTTTLLGFIVVAYTNCQQADEFYEKPVSFAATAGIPGEPLVPTESEVPEPSPCENGSTQDLICNPLGGDLPSPMPRAGLIANLYEGNSSFNHLSNYAERGFKHPENIFFSNFNVAPRSFSDGFSIGENDFLKTQTGTKLIEWFAIHATGFIGLPKAREEGFYHIVTVSDDGVEVSVDGKVMISHPDNHAPTIDCAGELVQFEKGKEKSFELGYHQGPRYEIALMTFIKKVDPATFKRDGFCSAGYGNSRTLTDNGYEIIEPEWFTLPAGY
jgi:hypothetical protein